MFSEDAGNAPVIYAGKDGIASLYNSVRLESLFRNPAFLTFNQADGMLYVSDSGNHVIRRVRPGADGTVETFAGTGTAGNRDGDAASATFNNPQGIALDGEGNLWVVDSGNHLIRRINLQTRVVQTVAGTAGSSGSADGIGGQARFYSPRGIALETEALDRALLRLANGGLTGTKHMLVADSGNNSIRRISFTGNVETLSLLTAAASSPARVQNRLSFLSPAQDAAAQLSAPGGIATDSFGSIFVTEPATGLVKSILPNGTAVLAAPRNTFISPQGVAISDSGRVIVASAGNSAQSITFGQPEIEAVTPGSIINAGGTFVTVTGRNFAPGTIVVANGVVVPAIERVNTEKLTFTAPPSSSGMGTLTIMNRGGIAQKSLVVTPARLSELQPGFITTIAGGSTFAGDGGDATQAEIREPGSTAIDSNGNLYIADTRHFSVRRIDSKTGIITTVAGTGREPVQAQGGSLGVPATAVDIAVKSIAVDGAGNLLIAGGLFNDTYQVDAGGIINLFSERSIDYLAVDGESSLFYKKARPFGEIILKHPANGGTPVTIAGGGSPADGVGDGLPATQATFANISGLAIDSSGNVLVTDSLQNRVRRVDRVSGTISTIAGTGSAVSTGDNGLATSAGLEHPSGIAVNAAADIYFSEASGRVRKIDHRTGIISTVVQLSYNPESIAIDGADNLYVSTEDRKGISKIDTRTGVVRTVAGRPDRAIAEGVPAVQASLVAPTDITLDAAGDLVIVDTGDSRVRKIITASGLINTVAGTGLHTAFLVPAAGQNARQSSFNQPSLVATDSSRNIFFLDWGTTFQEQIVWKVDAATGNLSRALTFAGSDMLTGLAIGAGDRLLYATSGNRISKVESDSTTSTRIAGVGQWGYAGDGGPATAAMMAQPTRLDVTGTGNLYVAEYDSASIRKVDTSGIITTAAGGPGGGFPNTSDVAVDTTGNVYILTTNSILRVDALTGVITTVAYREYGAHTPLGDNGPAISAGLGAKAIAVDSDGNLFVADDANKRIRAIRLPPPPPIQPVDSLPCGTIAANQTINATLSTSDYLSRNRSGSYADCYRFTAAAGDRISIAANSTTFDPYLYLLNSTGQVVTSSLTPTNHGARIPSLGSFVLPRTGTYTIEAAGYSSASLGSYSLTLIANPSPLISSIEPSSAVAGSTVTLTVHGTNFNSGATLSIGGAGVSIGSIRLTDSTLLTASLNFAADAAPGPRAVTLTTNAGTSPPLTFLLIPQPPTVTSVLPNSANAGRNATVTIVGSNFVAGATAVTVSGTGVSATATSFVSPERIDADLSLALDAATTSRGLTVTTAGGSSAAVTFTVLPRGATLSSVDPATAAAGSTVTLTLTGTNFVAQSTSVSLSGGGVTVGMASVISTTSLTVSLTIAPAAATGARNLTITTPDGTSNPLTFTVTAPLPPTCTQVTFGQAINGALSSSDNPSQQRSGSYSDCYAFSGTTGDRVIIAMSSTVFNTYLYLIDSNNQVVTTGSGFRDSRIPASGSFALPATGTYTIEATSNFSAAVGTYSLTVSLFPHPTLASIDPTSITAGTNVTATLRGTNFVTGATNVVVTGNGLTVGTVSLTSATSLTVDLSANLAATPGSRDVTVTTSGGTTAAVSLTVTPAAPPSCALITAGQSVVGSLSASDYPSRQRAGSYADCYTFSGTAGDRVSIAMTSSTLTSAYLYLLNSSGQIVSTSGGSSSDARIPASGSFSLPSTGAYTIEATSFYASAVGAYSLTLTYIQRPTLSAIDITSAAAGSTIVARLTGTNFVADATAVSVSGSGITVGAVSVSSTASLTVTLSIALTAPTGSRDITVTTAGGASGAVSFNVTAAPVRTCLPISPGQLVNGTLSTSDYPSTQTSDGYSDCYTFSGTVNDQIVISMNASGFTNYIFLLSATGDSVTYGTGSSSARIPSTGSLRLPATGTYTIEVMGLAASSLGPYSVSLTYTRAPTLSSIDPTAVSAGSTVSMTLTGTNFVTDGTAVTIAGSGVSLGPVTVTSPTSLTASVSVALSAPAGPRNIAVTTSGGLSNAVSFTVNPPGPPACTPITLGQPVNADLSTSDYPSTQHPGSYSDCYTFSGNAGDQIVLTMSSSAFTNYLALLNATGQLVSSGSGSNTRIPGTGTITLPATGTYVVEATSFSPSSTGSYILTATSSGSGSGPRTCPTIALNQNVNGSLTTSDYQSPRQTGSYADCYTFAGNSGDQVIIAMNTSAFWPYLYLLDAGGQVLSYGNGSSDARIPSGGSFTLPGTGTYTIEATRWASGPTGNYSLMVTYFARPTLTAINTSSAAAGSTVPVTLTGTNFVTGSTTVGVSGGGVIPGTVTVNSPTSLTVNLSFTLAAASGLRNITVTANGITSNALTINVTAAPPPVCVPIAFNQAVNAGLSSTDHPATQQSGTYSDCYTLSARAGDQIVVSMNASAFYPVLYLIDAGGQVASYYSSVSNNARIPAYGGTFEIPATGTYTVEATSYYAYGFVTGSYDVTVTYFPKPTITSINPATAAAGSTVTVSLTGTNFTQGSTTVTVTGSGITAGAVTVASPTSMTVSLSLTLAAATGTRSLNVNVSGVISNTVAFTVTAPPAPVCVPINFNQAVNASLSVTDHPATQQSGTYSDCYTFSAHAGDQVIVTMNASGFYPHPYLLDAAGQAVASYSGVSNNARIPNSGTVTLPGTGAYTIEATSYYPYGFVSGPYTLTVTYFPKPALTSASPASAQAGSAVNVTLTGTNFVADATTVAVSGSGVTVGTVNVTSPTSLTVGLSFTLAAATGPRNVTVTVAGVTSDPLTYTVTDPPPATCIPITLGQTVQASLSVTDYPSSRQSGSYSDCYTFSGSVGDQVAISMSSSSFWPYVYLIDAGGQVVGSASGGGSDPARIPYSGTLALPATGSYVIEATRWASSYTGDYSLLVSYFPRPTITSISPSSAARGSTVAVTVNGTNFISGSTTVDVGTAITVGAVSVTSSTSLTVNLTIGASATTGPRSLTVTSAGITSAAATFTVNP